jgi:hypothetical protein
MNKIYPRKRERLRKNPRAARLENPSQKRILKIQLPSVAGTD